MKKELIHLFTNLELNIACELDVYSDPVPDCTFKPSEITCPKCIAVWDAKFDVKLMRVLRLANLTNSGEEEES